MRRWTVITVILFVMMWAQVQAQVVAGIYSTAPAEVNTASQQVTLQFVVRQPYGVYALDELTASNFQLSDDATNINVSSTLSLPLRQVFVVDLGIGSDADLIRDALRSYVLNFYQAGDDLRFAVLDGEDNSPRIVSVASRDEALDAIAQMQRGNRVYSIAPALEAALELVAEPSDDPSRAAQVLLFSSYLNDPSEATLGTTFRGRNVPLHIVQAHRSRQSSTTAFRNLSNAAGGLYSNNQGGRFVLTDLEYQATNTLKILYDALASERRNYTLRYTTTGTDVAERSVDMTARLADGSSLRATFAYTWQFLPPEVRFTVEGILEATRRGLPDGQGGVSFDINQLVLPLDLVYPDGVERDLATIRLEVRDQTTGNLLQSTLDTAPQRDVGGQYNAVWDLASYATFGDLRYTLAVNVVDTAGLAANATTEARLAVIPPQATPTPIPPSPTPLPATAAPIEPTAQATAVPSVAITATRATSDSLVQAVLIGAIVLLSLLVLLLGWVLWRRNRQLAQSRRQLRQMELDDAYRTDPGLVPSGAANAPATTASGNAPSLVARLYAVHGLEANEPDEYVIDEGDFTIGRAPENRLVLAKPIVSPRHCRIRVHDGDIVVRDFNSKNGTYLNGERIPPERDISVPIGSEIGVTRNIVFEIWDANAVVQRKSKKETDLRRTTGEAKRSELVFKPLPGLRYIEDSTASVDDEYSPL